MSEKRLNNTIFLMVYVMDLYCQAHHLTTEEFIQLDQQYDILNYISECPDIFDGLDDREMLEEIDQFIV